MTSNIMSSANLSSLNDAFVDVSNSISIGDCFLYFNLLFRFL